MTQIAAMEEPGRMKIKRWRRVYDVLLKTGVITTEEIMQIAGVSYKEVWQIIMDLTYQCPLYRVSAGVYKLLTDKDMQEYENLQDKVIGERRICRLQMACAQLETDRVLSCGRLVCRRQMSF